MCSFPEILEGLDSSGRPVGFISTDPDTSPTPGSRVMAQNPGGELFFTVYGYLLEFSDRFSRKWPGIFPGFVRELFEEMSAKVPGNVQENS